MDHLAARGVPCPTPVRGRDGRLWTRLNGKPAALLSWLDGLSVHRPSAQQCADVASASAQLHETGQGFPLSRPNALGPDSWRRLVDATSANADRVQPGLAALMAEALGEIDRHWPTGLPGGIIHADLFPDNVLFMEGRLSGLIDFYFACNDAFAYDLAVMLNAWCFESDGSYNITRGKSLIASYAKVRALTAAERDAFPMLARGAALRFLLTRLFDWLNPDPQAFVRPKDPRVFAKRLRFHLKATSAAAYGF
jgi:homoserine kinase type II